ncbi:hypothetical protein C8R46DRAFT_1098744 [Mycena filopes]|nr:hypothetical protein C8R46DRAFT_1098744 [Mycena filopes]
MQPPSMSADSSTTLVSHILPKGGEDVTFKFWLPKTEEGGKAGIYFQRLPTTSVEEVEVSRIKLLRHAWLEDAPTEYDDLFKAPAHEFMKSWEIGFDSKTMEFDYAHVDGGNSQVTIPMDVEYKWRLVEEGAGGLELYERSGGGEFQKNKEATTTVYGTSKQFLLKFHYSTPKTTTDDVMQTIKACGAVDTLHQLIWNKLEVDGKTWEKIVAMFPKAEEEDDSEEWDSEEEAEAEAEEDSE